MESGPSGRLPAPCRAPNPGLHPGAAREAWALSSLERWATWALRSSAGCRRPAAAASMARAACSWEGAFAVDGSPGVRRARHRVIPPANRPRPAKSSSPADRSGAGLGRCPRWPPEGEASVRPAPDLHGAGVLPFPPRQPAHRQAGAGLPGSSGRQTPDPRWFSGRDAFGPPLTTGFFVLPRRSNF